MANFDNAFRQKRLADLLNSPDPESQAIVAQILGENNNETARLGNYPNPVGGGGDNANETARLGNYPAPQAPAGRDWYGEAKAKFDAERNSALSAQHLTGNTDQGITGGGGVSMAGFGAPQPQQPQPNPASMSGQPSELQPNSFRNNTTGKVTKLSDSQPMWAAQQNQPEVLQQITNQDGTISRILKMPAANGASAYTTFDKVYLPGMSPNDERQAKIDKANADIAHVKASTNQINTPQRAPSLTEVVDPTDPRRMIRIDSNIYRGGGAGSPGVVGVSGKEPSAAKREETVTSGLDSFNTQISALRRAYDTLNANGDIVNSDSAGVGNVLPRIQSSGLGQTVGGVFGTKSQDARAEIKGARNVLLATIKNATGMTSKDMDTNADIQRWMQSVTDPTNSYQANMAVLKNIEDFVAAKSNAITKLSPSQGQAPAARAVSMDEIMGAARASGKSVDQVLKDARAKGYQVKGL